MSLFLVTGGAGFIGSNIASRLCESGHEVRILDNFSTGRRENIHGFRDCVEVIEGDLRRFDDVRAASRGVDYVIHEGALPSVPRSIKDPLTSHDVNVNGTVHVLESARIHDVKRVVFASSSSVYGDSKVIAKSEDMAANPVSPYAVTKLVGERYCGIYWRSFGIETVCLRYFNVFGPRQDPGSQYSAVVPKFISALMGGEKPVIYGDGRQSRDFTYVDNVVDGTILASTSKQGAGGVFNIACSERITVNTAFERIRGLLGSELKAEYAGERPGDVKHSLADITRMREVFGYQPKVSFEEGIVKTVNWYQR